MANRSFNNKSVNLPSNQFNPNCLTGRVNNNKIANNYALLSNNTLNAVGNSNKATEPKRFVFVNKKDRTLENDYKQKSTINSITNYFSKQKFVNTEKSQVEDCSTVEKFGNDNSNKNQEQSTNNQTYIFGKSTIEKTCFFTGTIEKVIKWRQLCNNQLCYFEVFGSIVSIQKGPIREQKVLLLRDKRGPILQVMQYSTTRIELREFDVGLALRCVGRMVGPNILCAVSIEKATAEELTTLQRHCYISEHAISNIFKY